VGARVDAWLTAAGVTTRRFDCPYDFCAALSTGAVRQPELVLIGTELLDDAELAIVEYVRRRWPDVPLVLYGRRCDAHWPLGRVLSLDSPAALLEILRGSPDDLLRRIDERRRAQARVVEVVGRPARTVPAAPRPSAVAPSADARPPATSNPPSARQPADPEAPITSSLPLRSLLSPEELAALLEGPSRGD